MPPGSFIINGLKNLKQLRNALRLSGSIYSFNQRKNNRLVGLFFASCIANFALIKRIEYMELQICQSHKKYIQLIRQSDQIYYAGQ